METGIIEIFQELQPSEDKSAPKEYWYGAKIDGKDTNFRHTNEDVIMLMAIARKYTEANTANWFGRFACRMLQIENGWD